MKFMKGRKNKNTERKNAEKNQKKQVNESTTMPTTTTTTTTRKRASKPKWKKIAKTHPSEDNELPAMNRKEIT